MVKWEDKVQRELGLSLARYSTKCILTPTLSKSATRTSLVAQTVKRLLIMRETGLQSLCWEDLLEKEMATHSSILTWKIPWTEEPSRLQSMGLQRVGHG